MVLQASVRLVRSALALAAAAMMAAPALAQIETMTVPDKPEGAHWIWVNNLEFGHHNKYVLYNADTGDVLGSIDAGWEGIKQEFSRSSNELYSAATYMSRGFRGERTDVIGVFDKHTLMPLREIVMPIKTIKGWPDPTLTALSDDDAFMFVQALAPGSTIGVADIKNNKFASVIETAGCAHVMAAGKRRFFSLCGDGSLLEVVISDTGLESSRKRHPGFFDADADPVHGSGTRAGDIWYFVSHRGQIHAVDVSGPKLKFLPRWQVATPEGDKTWVPSAWMQSVAVNRRLGRIYLAMQLSDLKPKGGGFDFHAKDGSEVWSFDLKTRKLLQRIAVPAENPISHVAVSQDLSPLVYAGSLWSLKVGIYDEKSGKRLRELFVAEMPTVLQPVD